MSRALLFLLLACLPACGVAPAPSPRAEALHWSVETADGRFLGSATALGAGRLLTNRHVVGGHAGLVLVRDGQRRAVQGIRPATGLDAALLEVAGPDDLAAPALGPVPAAGAPLAVAGARSGQRQSGTGLAESPRFGSGFAVAQLPAAPGYSGGPVLDAEGRLVGIVAAAVAPDMAAARALSSGGADRVVTLRRVLYLPIGAVLRAVAPEG
jgi:S1-C subfamily serine protease